ncbi:hypothetical protein PVAND_004046 [Polypedilum vanderplanki]|uniref:Uncharacterized protein n=1 Tax=Polypedilum vanderplanki TaxID=319348 RepID=A0A9J6BVV4_POLVA|nr:hypothetical protein PVAND_004046 [Polypedilum vanderplanki]
MFEFMTSDERKPLPVSIEDLIEMNYTVCLNEFKYDIFKEQLNGRESPKFIANDSYTCFEFYKEVLFGNNPSKYAFFLNINEHAFWNSTTNISLPIMENEMLEKLVGTQIPKNNILLHPLIEVINCLVPSGIIEHLVDFSLWHAYRALKVEPEDSRRVLSMSDLEFGFVIFLGALSLPIFFFICEIHALYVRKQLRNLLGLYEFVRVIRERLKDYHDEW